MPISSRAIRALHQTLGDDAAGDVVSWIHDTDATRVELRELIELQARQFGSLLDARLAEFHRVLSGEIAVLRLEVHDAIGGLRAEVHDSNGGVRTEMRDGDAAIRLEMAALETRLERALKEQTRWMFVAWASLLIPIIGLWMRA